MTIDRLGKYWPWLAALTAGTLLAIAHAFETFGHYPPCELCLKQRDVYWLIFWGGLVLTVLLRVRPSFLRWCCALLALAFFAESALAVYHAGVEWKWWAGPTSCTSAGVHRVSVADMSSLLSGKPQHIIQCDVAAFRFIGLSMAGWNAVTAFVLALISLSFILKANPDA